MRGVSEHADAVRDLILGGVARAEEWVDISAIAERELSPSPRDRRLSRDVLSPVDLPPFDNSQMDGYAVNAREVEAGGEFPVAHPVAAGDVPPPLAPGGVTPIMTGAPIPGGADAVIPVESSSPGGFAEQLATGRVSFTRTPEVGDYVRRRGDDVAVGGLLLSAGDRLGPAQVGVLASAGVTKVAVTRPLHVVVISTGRELAPPGELAPGKIFDANGPMLAAAVRENGATSRAVQVCDDDPEQFMHLLAEVASSADIIVTTAGVSAGAFEVVRESLTPLGVTFGGVAMQPRGPPGWGRATLGDRDIPIVCFPGNPVSALISFEMFLRPVLREFAGLSPVRRPELSVPLAESVESPPGKHQVRRGRITADGTIELVGGAGSHLLAAYAQSTALVHIPVGVAAVDAGTPITAWRIDD